MRPLGLVLALLALGILFGGGGLPVLEIAQASSRGRVRLTESNAQRVVLELTAPSFTTRERTVDGATYLELDAAGWGHTNERGKPRVPLYGTLIAIPQSAQIDVRVTQDQTRQETLSHPILPSPTARVGFIPEESLAQFEGLAYVPDPATYSTAAPYPAETVSTSNPALWRSQRYVRVQLRPFQFNPITRELTVHEKMRVEINFGLAPDAAETQLGTNVLEGAFEAVLKNGLANYESARAWRTPRRPAANAPKVEHAASAENAFRIAVNADGMYRVTCEALQAAGLHPDSYTLDTLKLSFKGNEVAIQANDDGDDVCESGESFIFFGQAPTDYTVPYNVYWLTAGGAPGKRMDQRSVSGGATPESYIKTLHVEQNLGYSTAAPWIEVADHWCWKLVNHPTNSTNVTATLNDLVPGATDGVLRVFLQSGGLSNRFANLHSTISANGAPVNTQNWQSGTVLLNSGNVNNLASGENTFTIQDDLYSVTGVTVCLNYVELDYPAQFAAENDALRFKYGDGGSWDYQVEGFTNSNLAAYDITDVNNVVRLPVTATPSGGGYRGSFGDTIDATHEYFVLTNSQFKTPLEIVQDTPSDLRGTLNGADYILITYGAWKANVQPLAAQRKALGRVVVVDVQDIYDEFNYGTRSAQAIRDFLAYAYANWQVPKPSNVLLVGNGNYDNGFNETVFIPPYMKLVDPWIGMAASDHNLVTLDAGTPLPSMAIGRLPALSAADVDAMVSKLRKYENQIPSGSWRNQIMFVADNAYEDNGVPDSAGNFFQYSDEVASDPYYLPSPLAANRVYFNPCIDTATYPWCSLPYPSYPTAVEAKTAIKNGYADGRVIINFVGHGATLFWAHQMLTSPDVSQLTRDPNDPKYPFVLPMTCLEGNFAIGGRDSVSEAMMRQQNGGAIGSYAPAGLGVATGHDYLNRGFFEAIAQQGKPRAGEAAIQAMVKLYTEGAFSLDLLDTFNLLGDPGTLLSLPDTFRCAERPNVPLLTSPAADAVGKKKKVTLKWDGDTCTKKYKVRVKRQGQKAFIVRAATTKTKYAAELEKGHTYTWRIIACNGEGCTKSPWQSFTIQ